MRIATVNVNGIRAAARKGMDQWLRSSGADVVLLQEVRAEEPVAASLLPGYEAVTWPCRVKGRAGVSVAVRQGGPVRLGQVRYGVAPPGTQEPDVDSGRWLEADLLPASPGPDHVDVPDPAQRPVSGQATHPGPGAPDPAPGPGAPGQDPGGPGTPSESARPLLTVVSAYFHAGQVGTERMGQKYAHLSLVDARMSALLASAADGPQVLVAGDLNIVHTASDIRNWRSNHNRTSGVLDEEIAYLDTWFSSGWVDTVRRLAGPVQGPYTWWSQRGSAFENNTGWRIDYHLTTPSLAALARSFAIDKAARRSERWSDHAPLVVDYDL